MAEAASLAPPSDELRLATGDVIVVAGTDKQLRELEQACTDGAQPVSIQRSGTRWSLTTLDASQEQRDSRLGQLTEAEFITSSVRKRPTTCQYHRLVSEALFVPADFAVPHGLTADQFRLEPLGPQHNPADYAAWTSSMDQIRATPGFTGASWPRPMSLADNLRDLERHANDFLERRGFTYTVLDTTTGDVIGCVYIYPPRGGAVDERHATVESWVRADHAALDPVLYHSVRSWLERDWPFAAIDYAPRS